MTSKDKSYINYTFKMLYVIAIVMVIDGHIGSFDYLSLNGLLRYQNYHVALFMFVSGYFLNLKYGYKEFAIRKFSKLIIPLYIWNLFYGIICYFMNNYFGFNLGGELSLYNLLYAPLIDGHQFIYNMASWFLVPLFLVQIFSFVILKPAHNYKQSSLLFFIFCLIISCIALPFAVNNGGKPSLELLIFRTLYFLPSFAFGYLYKNIIEKYDNINSFIYLFFILLILSFLYKMYPNYNHTPSWLNDVSVNPLVIYTICFLSILFWTRIARILSPIIVKSKGLKIISDNTFDLMVHHFAGFVLIKSALKNMPDFNDYLYKNDIWYYYWPIDEIHFAWVYIYITIVISIFIGFTSQTINDKINQLLTKTFYR